MRVERFCLTFSFMLVMPRKWEVIRLLPDSTSALIDVGLSLTQPSLRKLFLYVTQLQIHQYISSLFPIFSPFIFSLFYTLCLFLALFLFFLSSTSGYHSSLLQTLSISMYITVLYQPSLHSFVSIYCEIHLLAYILTLHIHTSPIMLIITLTLPTLATS